MIRRAIAISASINGRRHRTISIAAENYMRRCIKSHGSHLNTHMISTQQQSRMYTAAAAFTSSMHNGIGCNSGHTGSVVAMGSPSSLAAVGHSHYNIRSPLHQLQLQHSSFFHTSIPVWNKKKKKKRNNKRRK